jgi:hypothetical protein
LGSPLGKSGGVTTSIFWFKTGEEIIPFRSFVHATLTSYWCLFSIIFIFKNYKLELQVCLSALNKLTGYLSQI